MTFLPVPRIVPKLLSLAVVLGLLVTSAAFASGPAKKAAPPDAFLPFDPVTVSVLERMRARGFLTVEFGLYVPDKKLRAEIETRRRALGDAYVRALVVYGADVARVDVAPDLASITDRLQRVTDDVLGQPGARVLLSQAQLRRLH
jgi:hypothetical protein